ncbi:MAG: hypothetical protein PHC29_05085 [Candidatus Omnitrophica bacterium]|nr:hypothetical protein [Candidatus Omnitrophota bacterium]
MRIIIAFVIIATQVFFYKACFSDIVILEDKTLFEGEQISGNKFKVDGGFVIFSNPLWKIVSIEKRMPTDNEKKSLIVFKASDYDIIFNERGEYSAPLTSFEKNVGKRVQAVFDTYPSLSDKACIEMVAKEFKIAPTIIDQIFLKAALKTGGKL